MTLYDARHEHDGCGVACVAKLGGEASHETVVRALRALENLEHRGAEGADAETGDGAGILVQLPHGLLEIGEPGTYGVAVCLLPDDADRRHAIEATLERTVAKEGQRVLGWSDVPVAREAAGEGARASAPVIRRLAIGAREVSGDAFERKLYVIRRQVELACEDAAFASCSSRTMVLKGMLSAPQLPRYFPELSDARLESALAVVHSRFSTNTFPSWKLAHPNRLIAHNGEFNTLRGNLNWLRARERGLSAEAFGADLPKVLPLVGPGESDSAAFDRVLELLVMAGRSLPHALMMLVPEAWEGRDDLPEELEGFYAFHEHLTEPWDGPASITFSDGRILGARLDRNGLRPGRWAVTDDGWVVLASETGALPLEPERVIRRGRLRPGALFIVDVEGGRVLSDRQAELEVARAKPYGRWAAEAMRPLAELPPASGSLAPPAEAPDVLRLALGYTREDLEVVIAPMARTGKEPTGSMGGDAAPAALSRRSPPLFAYFRQLFAQVTNPAIDPLREEIVMSLATALGPHAPLLRDAPSPRRRVRLPGPVLQAEELERVLGVGERDLPHRTLDATWAIDFGPGALRYAIARLTRRATQAAQSGARLLVISDRGVGRARAAIPSLLATAAVHHELVRAGLRPGVSLIVDSGEPREVHHVACLIGFGADAVHPWLLLETAEELEAGGADSVVAALHKGLLKVMSKMGISTVSSYRGAQAFEAIGLADELIEQHFTGAVARLGGAGLDDLARQALARHARAYGPHDARAGLPGGGLYRWRRDGERHSWDPETVTGLQRAIREPQTWEQYSEAARGHGLRALLEFAPDTPSIPVEEVEPAGTIVARFATGAMSLGSISPEAHETLAVAMNRLGGRSNTGEGGEDPARFSPDPDGDSRRSAIKQIASARFGVTIDYLVNADELQIKIAQGAKPGEGGQLPGDKVDERIARLRYATPGVELISPPPHHDIYSIEDLKQLIHDLRCANPAARISVKLAAEAGVGTVAAGVVKALADHVVIAGHDGGTGAAPQSSLHGAGIPWELGLAETQQTLVRNGLRSRVVLQADGGMRTGRDVVVAALLGAEEFGFSTAPLIALGCIMMRVCHLNTCPVGIATQDPELRRRFAGRPEQVVRFLVLVAEDARRIMASLGIGRFDDLIGRADLLRVRDDSPLDLTALLTVEPGERRMSRRTPREREALLDDGLVAATRAAMVHGRPVKLEREVTNADRAVGALLSGSVARRHGARGLAEGSIEVTFTGSGGQSFGAWLAPGITFTVHGDVNDYAGKGLSGGVLAVRPSPSARLRAEANVIAGNTTLYGATSGRAFFRGQAGERFAVRNSGAVAVVEGVGDHGCEYMTGGVVAVLGPTGRNFAAGMSGGIAYVLDDDEGFAGRCNHDLVDLEALGGDDARDLRALVEEHERRTGSGVAAALLADWNATVERCVKVMPRDYRAALEAAADETPAVAA